MKQLISILLVCLAGLAGAAPVTVFFAGSVYQYQTGAGYSFVDDSSKVGLGFSGSLTFDTANGQVRDFSADPFNTFVERMSQTGCAAVFNGVCQSVLPYVTPVVTNFEITLDGIAYGPFGDPANSLQGGNVRKTITDTFSQFMMGGGSSRQSLQGDPSSLDYTLTNQGRQLTIIAQGDSAWIGDLLNLGQLPDFSSLWKARNCWLQCANY